MKARRLLLACVVGVVAAGGWLSWALLRPGPDAAITLDVPEGASETAVLRSLESAGLLPSVPAGRLWLTAASYGRSFHWGRYRFPPRTPAYAAIERLLDGRVETIAVTVPEGLTARETADRFVQAGIGTEDGWSRAVGDVAVIRMLAPRATSLEGFLFPDTYRFSVGMPAASAARHLVDRFREVWKEARRDAGPPWGRPSEIVTLASLVQAESGLEEELPLIAGVYRNRLRRGMLLQCDPTVIYALKRQGRWTGRLLRQDLAVDDPYNTYRYPGLPPTPINSPGRPALAAALHPADTRFLYFVARPGGGHTFSRTLREHNRAVARLRKARSKR